MGRAIALAVCSVASFIFWRWVSGIILKAMFEDWDKTLANDPNWAFLEVGLVAAFTIGSIIGLAKLFSSNSSS